MNDVAALTRRYFLSYAGVKLPLNMVNEIQESDLNHRNTYFRTLHDGEGRVVFMEKLVYGEVHLSHRYEYHGSGALKLAEIQSGEDDEATVLSFDEAGKPV
jgi:hypothetical protein